MIEAAAAIRKDGKVWTLPRPARHADVLWLGVEDKEGPVKLSSLASGEQGFVTDDGDFLGRVEAAAHAIGCKQIKPEASVSRRQRGYLNHPPNLYSEDLW